MDVLQILKPRFHRLQLKGFQKGVFNYENNKLCAYTLLSVQDAEFEDLNNWFLHNKGYSQYDRQEDEPYRTYNDNGTYSYKPVEQLVKEKLLNYVSIRFYGVVHEEEWFIIAEHSFFGEQHEETIIHHIERTFIGQKDFFTSSIFELLPPFVEEIDYIALTETVSKKVNRHLSWFKDYKFIDEQLKDFPPEQLPKKLVRQPVDRREYVGQPWVVAHIKQEQKSKINRAYEIYINEAIFLSFVQQMKIRKPEEFMETETLYSDYYPLIYPDSKEYVIGVMKAISEHRQSRLYYFLYLPYEKKMFEWTKPPIHEVPGHHAEWILEDIKTLSVWGSEFTFHEPSVTMDDPVFWNDHVFKKEHGDFIYLRPVS